MKNNQLLELMRVQREGRPKVTHLESKQINDMTYLF